MYKNQAQINETSTVGPRSCQQYV